MASRAFPVVYAADVEASAAFYERLGFVEFFRLPPAQEGPPGYVGMRRDTAELALVTTAAPAQTLGVTEIGPGPRFELYVYVDDVDTTLTALTAEGVPVLREPTDMPWGERLAHVADPDGNPVALCQTPDAA
jgi:lactoylglutathione lyase